VPSSRRCRYAGSSLCVCVHLLHLLRAGVLAVCEWKLSGRPLNDPRGYVCGAPTRHRAPHETEAVTEVPLRFHSFHRRCLSQVSQLKALLGEAGVSCQDCVEKADLVERCLQLVTASA
jgi:hypothetical protein